MPAFKFPSVNGFKLEIYKKPREGPRYNNYIAADKRYVVWEAPSRRQMEFVHYAQEQMTLWPMHNRDQWSIQVKSLASMEKGYVVEGIVPPGKIKALSFHTYCSRDNYGIIFQRIPSPLPHGHTKSSMSVKRGLTETTIKMQGPVTKVARAAR
jgi:hypothetical protein